MRSTELKHHDLSYQARGLRSLEEQSGNQLSVGPHTSATPEDVDAVRLLMPEAPLWNGIRLDIGDC
jgi:hypothetical protein